MWSVDINDDYCKEINLYQLDFSRYLKNDFFFFGGSSYSYNGEDYEYQNNYYFWKDSLKNLDLIKDKILSSPFLKDDVSIKNILIPEFLEWYEKDVNPMGIVTSNKKYCDSIYYMSLNVDMLLIFLNKFNYPINQIKFIESNRDKLNHLLYDVSINYKMNDGKLKILKSGYYGTI